jgi:cell wall-associated NlpC family hydrolase
VTLKKVLFAVLVMLVGVFLLASESGAAPYQQVIDNSTKGRFKASSEWDNNTHSPDRYGKNYRATKPADSGAAMYKVRTPRKGYYTVCGRWPDNDRYNRSTPVKVGTVDGVKVRRLDQRKNSGEWVEVGTFKMKAGDGYKIRVSRNSDEKGYVVADAFKVVRSPNSRGVECRSDSSKRGSKVYEKASEYLDTRYVLGNPDECILGEEMDCSCLTMAAYRKIGVDIPEDPDQQWDYGRKVGKPRKGDLLFYREDGPERPITHVGIFARKGKILHASSYSGKVTIGKMRWPGDGYIGARRLV